MSKNIPVGFVYSEDYDAYNFGENHPLTPLRIEMTYALMKEYNLLNNPKVKLLEPRRATDKEVLRIHNKGYLDKLKELGQMDIKQTRYMVFPEYGLGPGDNPIFPNMYEASMLVCGASLTAADYLLENEEAIYAHNILGGLHHAMPDMASGFCILNDVAVAIEHIKSKRPNSRLLYVDIDCHHGDGVQWIFYDRRDVLTLSFHQDGRTLFPGTGHLKETGKGEGLGYSLNVPMPPRCPDSIYLPTYKNILRSVIETYLPDFIVFQTGVDTHYTDPLTQMNLTTSGHEKIFLTMLEYVEKYSVNKLLVVGGGGYNVNVVGRSWTLLLAALIGEEIGEPLPAAWIKLVGEKWPENQPPELLRDSYPYIEQMKMRNPYFFDELQRHVDDIEDIFKHKLIPNISAYK